MSVKLRKPMDVPTVNGTASDAPSPIPLQPLQVDGIVMNKTSLLRALAPYGSFTDIQPFEDGERYLLTIGAPADTNANVPPS